MGLIPGPDTCDRQRLGQELIMKVFHSFGARATLVALLSKMCWTCLSSTAFLPGWTEKPYSKALFANPEVDCSRTNDPNLSIFNVLSLSLSKHWTAMFSSTGYWESFVKLVSKSKLTLSIPKPQPLEKHKYFLLARNVQFNFSTWLLM